MLRVEEAKKPQESFYTQKFSPQKVVIPLSQHTGALPIPIVKKKDRVKVGEVLAQPQALISSTIHSSIAGEVIGIKEGPHPLLKRCKSFIIEAGKESPDRFEDFGSIPEEGIKELGSSEILSLIKEAGIVGLGGAGFPTHIKLTPPKKVDTLIVNGCECEPYLTCDFRLMIEHTEAILKGIEIVARILEVKKVYIAIEENKLEAVKRFNSKLHTKKYLLPQTEVKVLESLYPQGAEKQLIYSLTKRKVPSGKLPFDVGCVVQNVGTCFAIYEAVYFRKPLIERIVTFAGSSLVEPKNLLVRIGTTLKELFEKEVLKFKREPKKIIFGGPMMGVALDSLDYPIIKTTSGVLFLSEEDLDLREESSCIKCGRCLDNCPMRLLPLEFVRLVKKELWQKLEEFYISDCIECGSCSFVCPAKIPIVNYIKAGKEKLRTSKSKA